MSIHPVVEPDWIPTAPVFVEETIDIAAPAEAVWRHIVDHERWPEWFTDLDRIDRIGTGEGVGSGRRATVRKIKFDEEFTAWDEKVRFAFAVVKSPFPILAKMGEEIVLKESETATTVTYRQGLEGKRYVGGLVAVMWKQAPFQVRSALTNLKQRIEQHPGTDQPDR